MRALVAQRAQPHDYLTSPATHMLSAANGDFGALSPLQLAEVLSDDCVQRV